MGNPITCLQIGLQYDQPQVDRVTRDTHPFDVQ